jgi:NAD(P)-dependent dehydrogenase (short-subunit alcohol dehydrogenase family)
LVKANIIGNIHLFNLIIPLVLRGQAKKLIAISSGLADPDLAAKFDVTDSAPYSISKAALNMAVAKFSAQQAKGALFVTISPEMVNTGLYNNGKTFIEDDLQKITDLTVMQVRMSRNRR